MTMQATGRAKPPATIIAAANPPSRNSQKSPEKRVQFPSEIKGDAASQPGKLPKKASQIDIKEAKAVSSALPAVARAQSLFDNSISINPPGPDVTFIVKGKQFSAHRKVLLKSECANFFALKLNQKAPIEIQELSASTFKSLIDFIYSSHLSLAPDTLFELYRFYRAQKFETLAKELETNMQSVVEWKNFSTLLRIARKDIPGTPLYQNLLSIGLQHSAYLWNNLDQIPLDLFLEILQHDHLNIASEHFLVKVIRCWLLMQPVRDAQIGDNCFKYLRFGCLSESERLHMEDVETLVSPNQWAMIQKKLKSTPKPQETFWRPRVPVLSTPRFVFTPQQTAERIKENTRHVYTHSLQLSKQNNEQKISIFIDGKMFHLTLRFEESDNPQRYPFKLYLDDAANTIDQKKVFLWLQTQIQPNAPAMMVRTLKDLRGGLSFTSRYLEILKNRPDNWNIRIAAVIFL